MLEKEEIRDKLIQEFSEKEIGFKQYLHKSICKSGPCGDVNDFTNDTCCAPFIYCIHALNQLHTLPKHPHCDCFYKDIEIKQIGTISKRQPAPDVWLKLFGKLPDYYITKKEAREKYGWNERRNTIAGKAPGKMIGNEIYINDKHRLPEKEGRTWKHCDIDYTSGRRNNLRLFYSNDGLMFYSTDHGETNFSWVN